MASYLVTGGCGFIGSHLVDELIKLGNVCVQILDDMLAVALKTKTLQRSSFKVTSGIHACKDGDARDGWLY